MADAATGITAISADLKTQWAKKIEVAPPNIAKFQNKEECGADFSEIGVLGRQFEMPIVTQLPESTSYNGTAGDGSTLEDAVALGIVNAIVTGYEQVTRVQTTYKALTSGDVADPKSFKAAVKLMMENMKNAAFQKAEMTCLYGQSGVGTVESASSADAGVTLDVVFTAASWIPMWWNSRKGCKFTFFNTNLSTIIGTSLVGTVTTVTTSTRTVNFTISGTGYASVVATNEVVPKGAILSGGTFGEAIGIHKQLTTTTGTMFNINRSTEYLFRATSKAVSGVLTRQKVIQGIQQAVDLGLDTDVNLWVAPNSWADLWAEDHAIRIIDSSYNPEKSKSGSRAFEFEYEAGHVTVKQHGYIKRGNAYAIPPNTTWWVGSTDLTFKMPGVPLTELFMYVQGTNKVEFQCMSDKQFFIDLPSRSVVFTGIVASS